LGERGKKKNNKKKKTKTKKNKTWWKTGVWESFFLGLFVPLTLTLSVSRGSGGGGNFLPTGGWLPGDSKNFPNTHEPSLPGFGVVWAFGVAENNMVVSKKPWGAGGGHTRFKTTQLPKGGHPVPCTPPPLWLGESRFGFFFFFFFRGGLWGRTKGGGKPGLVPPPVGVLWGGCYFLDWPRGFSLCPLFPCGCSALG